MKKMSVNDAAEYFGVSKEAIHNRIRRGSVESVVEDGVKMVLVNTQKTMQKPKTSLSSNKSSNDERYYRLLEDQNTRLQSRVETLEGETRTLRDQKEMMLIEERKKIERIYKEKDEQLKNILSTLSSQFMLSVPKEEIETLDAEIEVQAEEKSTLVSLKKYLKQLDYTEKKIKKIKVRFEKQAKKDDRIIVIGSKCYIDTNKYDYSDLIR